jgi:hypothetical protein
LFADVRYALRSFLKTPLFTGIAVDPIVALRSE